METQTEAKTIKMLINGELEAASSTLDVINPATGEPFAGAPDCSMEQLNAAMQAAEQAFESWRKDDAARVKALLACGRAMREHGNEIAEILTQEQGKPLAMAQGELAISAMLFDMMAALSIESELISEDSDTRLELLHKPLGVVAGITPWNFPVMMAVQKIVHALRPGNTLVLKPSPFTPLSTLKMGEVLQSALPPGVLNIISGGDALGALMCEHDAVRKIAFTGSVRTGKKIMLTAAPDLKRVTLELGGNDPAIVLGDVEPDQVAAQLFWGAFVNSGQACIAIKRLYVHESIYEAISQRMAEIARSVKVGNGMDPAAELGPINNRPQFERVKDLITDARIRGAEFLAGGDVIGESGYFIEPAIVTGIAEGVPLVDEEQFGPVLPIMPFSDIDEVMARANDTHFGLGGSVWSADVERAAELAAQLHCGTGWVNQHAAFSPMAPFGGVKWSGVGCENGRWGLEHFTESQVLNIKKSESRRART